MSGGLEQHGNLREATAEVIADLLDIVDARSRATGSLQVDAVIARLERAGQASADGATGVRTSASVVRDVLGLRAARVEGRRGDAHAAWSSATATPPTEMRGSR